MHHIDSSAEAAASFSCLTRQLELTSGSLSVLHLHVEQGPQPQVLPGQNHLPAAQQEPQSQRHPARLRSVHEPRARRRSGGGLPRTSEQDRHGGHPGQQHRAGTVLHQLLIVFGLMTCRLKPYGEVEECDGRLHFYFWGIEK